MSRVCHFTGKRTTTGNKISRRGKAKYLGGVGRKVTGISKRKFKPGTGCR
jgi:large subunit ribosomal protein L28